MGRLSLLALLVLIACVLAGAYGILHDQLTYTISPEYYTKFKFAQFQLLDSPLPERLRAVVVGFLASWWMGIPIGLLVGGTGMLHREPRRIKQVTWRAYLILIALTSLIALSGLAYGYAQTAEVNLTEYEYWFIPPDVVDLRRYLCVGYMHNASYLGGALSMLAAVIYQIVSYRRGRRLQPQAPA